MPSDALEADASKNRVDRISMKDGGYYAAVSAGPRAVVDGLTERAIAALSATGQIGTDQSLVIADFGAADGLIAIDLMSQLVDSVRLHAPDQPIRICVTDLPDTDFRPYFQAMSRPGSYAGKHHNVFVSTCGISFFEPLFAKGELNLGFSASAMHYLSRQPGPLGERLHSLNADEKGAAAFRAQAASDWEAILSARAAELAPDSRCIIAMLGLDDEGRHLGNTDGSNLFENYETLWASLATEGLITSEEFLKAAFQQHYRTRRELEAPFSKGGPASLQGLKLVGLEAQKVDCPFFAQWMQTGDTQNFAENFVKTHRSWTETVFANALDPERPLVERQQIIEELYARYVALVQQNPERHRKDLIHWIIEFKMMRS
ncbi:hypothetical protein [Stappia sp. ES.058]|uniref:hypothetical protein n=1 Tax=Stappia sp. ES.058 TaxID=1881061 RepID=UPI00087B3495|nr:hypothetical protein [Stappia sp. ES.058]SDU18769.1 SAM dependent carboxyl methyltransferase [Stappia sp. ES.058]